MSSWFLNRRPYIMNSANGRDYPPVVAEWDQEQEDPPPIARMPAAYGDEPIEDQVVVPQTPPEQPSSASSSNDIRTSYDSDYTDDDSDDSDYETAYFRRLVDGTLSPYDAWIGRVVACALLSPAIVVGYLTGYLFGYYAGHPSVGA